jgi:hypothetical protein
MENQDGVGDSPILRHFPRSSKFFSSLSSNQASLSENKEELLNLQLNSDDFEFEELLVQV